MTDALDPMRQAQQILWEHGEIIRFALEKRVQQTGEIAAREALAAITEYQEARGWQ